MERPKDMDDKTRDNRRGVLGGTVGRVDGMVLAFWGWEKSSLFQMPNVRPSDLADQGLTATCVPVFCTESTIRLIISLLIWCV
jgi:hypothetical protein